MKIKTLILSTLLAHAAAAVPLERWVYTPSNLLVDENITKLTALMKRARACGFTKMLLADSKFSRLDQMDKRYFRNLNQIKTEAAALSMEVIPAVFPIGYSNDMLHVDPNLAEGLPVRDAIFLVEKGEARPVADPGIALKGGACDNRKAWGFVDETIVVENGTFRASDFPGNSRFNAKVKVQPFHHYRLSIKIKTDNLSGGKPEMKALGQDNLSLQHTSIQVAPTQDWKTYDVTFNSLEQKEVLIYFGIWGGAKGTIWWDDASLSDAGLVNLLRRPGAPFTVKTESGVELKEGLDFEKISDPKCGRVKWGGDYETWHEPPVLKTKQPDGTKLKVSWFHPHIIYDEQVCACPSEPATRDFLQDQARRMHEVWGAKSYMMSHDEWRVLGWDDACSRRGLSAGALMADNLRFCTSLLKSANPGGNIYVWNDMFDPHHNAVKPPYYLVKGDLTGSWDGLAADVIVMNWNFGHRAESLKFFADRGNRQVLAGYYDDSAEQIGRWLEAAKGVKGVQGVMYTTWKQNYADLEAFARVVDRAEGK